MALFKKKSDRMVRRTLASILSILFALNPILPIFPMFECGEVNAADNSNWRGIFEFPDSLADGTYNTSGSGQTGYINFGTRPEVKYQDGSYKQATASAGKIKWLITGKDTDGNIVLYSEEPLMSAKTYDSNSNSIFHRSSNVYSSSNFRSQLQRIQESTDYFSGAEQGIMLNTTVNTSGSGSTTDKLYGLHAENAGSNSKDIYAGANNTLPVNVKYWKGVQWLRSPFSTSSKYALVAYFGEYVLDILVVDTNPAPAAASKLNLSSLIFAANAATSTSASGGSSFGALSPTAVPEFNLRVSGGSMGGTVSADADKITYTANTDERLVVLAQSTSGGTTYQYVKDGTGSSETLKLSLLGGLTTGTTYSVKAWTEKKASCGNAPMYYASTPAQFTFTYTHTIEPTVSTTTSVTYAPSLTLKDVPLPSTDGKTAGTWKWVQPNSVVGDVGTHTADATFTPSDTNTYNTVTKTITITVNKATLTASNFTFTPPSNLTYNGSAKTATVTANGLTGIGAITVKYYKDGSSEPMDAVPTEVGSYKVQIDVAESNNYVEKNNITADDWEFEIKYLEVGPDPTDPDYPDNPTNAAYQISGYTYENDGTYWLKDDAQATIKAADTLEGYKISSALNGTYGSSLVVDSWDAEEERIYLKDPEGHKTTGIKINKNIKQDKNAPEGSIALKDREPWQSFVNLITFGLFFKDAQTVTITAVDNESGIKESKYLISDSDLIKNANAGADEIREILENQQNWEVFTDSSIEISLEKDNKYVVYEKLTDNVGHVAYISSDGIVIDKIGPTISGVEEGIYYASRKVTVKDKYLDTVTVNGESQKVTDGKSEFTLKNNNTVYEIEAKDKVGNVTTRRVELKPVQQFTEKVEEKLPQKPTVDDIDNYRQAIIETDDFTAKEKNNLTDHEKNALTEKREQLYQTFKSLASEKSVNVYVDRSLPDVTVGNPSRKVLASHFTDDDTDIALNGGEVELKLEINPEQSVNDGVRIAENTSKKESLTVASYLDISVKKHTKAKYKKRVLSDNATAPAYQFEDEELEEPTDILPDQEEEEEFEIVEEEKDERLSDLSEEITISMDIPTKYQATDREFYMIKVHNGETSILKDIDNNPKTITFASANFSTYALAYPTIQNAVDDDIYENDTEDMQNSEDVPIKLVGEDQKSTNAGKSKNEAIVICIFILLLILIIILIIIYKKYRDK